MYNEMRNALHNAMRNAKYNQMHNLPEHKYIMSMIVSSYHYCKEQRIQTRLGALHDFPVLKLDFVIL